MQRPEQHLIDRVEAAEVEFAVARRALSDRIVELSPYKKGDIIRNVDTGALYRVDGGSGYLSSGRTYGLLTCTRVYSTKRRPARSTTHVSIDNRIEKYEGTVTL